MSDSTWIFITPFPLLRTGCLGTWCCRDLCRCDRKCLRRHMSGLIGCLLGNDSMDKIGASTIHYSISTTTSLLPTSHPSTVSAAREPGTRFTTSMTPTVVRSRPRTSRDPVAHHIATESRLRPSFFVHRELTAVSSFVLPPSRWPTPAGRRGHVRTAVLPPLFSHATSVRYWHIPSDILPNNNNKLTSVGTYILVVVFSCGAQHRTVIRSQ